MDEQQQQKENEAVAKQVKLMKKNIPALVVAGIIGGAIAIYWSVSVGSSQNSTHGQTSAPIVVSAAQLMSDYQNNQIGADNKYKGQNLEVAGVVQSVSRGIGDLEAFIVPDAQSANNIDCSFNEDWSDRLSTLNTGQDITVEGTGNGVDPLGTVMINNCALVQDSSTGQ